MHPTKKEPVPNNIIMDDMIDDDDGAVEPVEEKSTKPEEQEVVIDDKDHKVDNKGNPAGEWHNGHWYHTEPPCWDGVLP